MYDEILVPTDGSDASTAAVDHALELAKRYDARIHALYVVDTSVSASVETGSDIVLSALEKEGELAVTRIAEAAEAAGTRVETAVVSGNPYRSILSYVEDADVDLVVMGTHGRRGVERFLLGSVTERVVRAAEVPVLTVRWDEDAAEEHPETA